MDDRELLERAAMAAGIKYTKPHPDYTGVFGLVVEDEHGRPVRDWNPLEDDGDALRLAVKLRITVRLEDQAASIAGWAENQHVPFTSDGAGPWFWKEWGRAVDPYAATRRAIVRAAAALGGE